MNFPLRIPLDLSAAQTAQLQALQQAFAQVCNALAPLVQSTRVWNRVALHHLAYKELRKQYPEMGAQMVCNGSDCRRYTNGFPVIACALLMR